MPIIYRITYTHMNNVRYLYETNFCIPNVYFTFCYCYYGSSVAYVVIFGACYIIIILYERYYLFCSVSLIRLIFKLRPICYSIAILLTQMKITVLNEDK